MTRVPFDRISFKTIILSICLLWSAQSALATTVVPPLDEDMIVGARAIITGKVLQIESAIDEQEDRIYTYITVRVTEVIKGQITERKIILKEFGGVVGNRVSVVYGSPQFKRGEKVLLYLGTHNDGSLRTYQLFLGKFSIVRDDATGNRFAVRDSGGENVTVLTMQGQAQGDSTDRMELSSYTDMVRTKLASNLERSQAFEDTYYRNVPVLASPPGFVSSKKQVHSEYTFLGNVRWFQPDSGQVVPYTICPNPAQDAPQVVPDPNDIAAAANAWTGVPGSSLALSYSGNLDNCYTQMGTPGINIVSNNCDGYNQPSSGCANILAIGGWSAGGYQTRVIGGITFGQITQGFVSFNPWASCYFSDHCNFREIATHELGHALGLAHSADPTATMAAYAHFDGRCASIKQDEINGIKFLYPGSGGGPGPLAVVTSSLSGGTTGTPYSQPLTGSGGTLPYAWSLVAGLGTLPTGLSLSAAGTISGTPNTAGTYNFTVRVTDAASATAQKALSIVVVPAGAGPLNSQFVSQTVPTSLQPGQGFTVNMKFLNTGTQTWIGPEYYFASQNPALNSTWGGNGVSLFGFTAAPGEQLDVNFTATAPTTPGTYNFQWQMYQNGGVGFFGQMSTNVAIQVGNATNDTVGLYEPVGGAFFFKYSNSNGPADYALTFGPANQGWTQVAADWDGDGVDTIGLYYPANGAFFIRNSNTSGIADIYITYGPAGQGWIPVIGDWDGNGTDTLGLYNPGNGSFYLRNSNTVGFADLTFAFGPVGGGWIPIVGDWNGDGVDAVGLYNPATGAVQLRNSNTSGAADISFTFTGAGPTWKPIVGDWDGNGTSTLGVYNPATGVILLRNSNTTGGVDVSITWEPGGYVPFGGKWQ